MRWTLADHYRNRARKAWIDGVCYEAMAVAALQNHDYVTFARRQEDAVREFVSATRWGRLARAATPGWAAADEEC